MEYFASFAGAMSCSMLVMSPLARGLFRRAIPQSGSIFSGELVTCHPEKAAKNLREALAKKFPGLLL